MVDFQRLHSFAHCRAECPHLSGGDTSYEPGVLSCSSFMIESSSAEELRFDLDSISSLSAKSVNFLPDRMHSRRMNLANSGSPRYLHQALPIPRHAAKRAFRGREADA